MEFWLVSRALGGRASPKRSLEAESARALLSSPIRQHEIALVGIDDVTMADATEPRLTVVAQDPSGVGRAAGELLFARLDGAAGPTERVVMPIELLVRGSGEIRPPAENR